MKDVNRKRRGKPTGAGYKTGIYVIIASSLGLILGFILPWAKITGDELLSSMMDLLYTNEFWLSDYFFLLLLILFIGVTLVLLNFFEDVELISSIKSSWIKIGLENSLIVSSILLIFLSLYFLGLMITFNHSTIASDDITAILYTPAPLMLTAVGVFNLYIGTRTSKKEPAVIEFETFKTKNTPVKKKVVKGGERI